MSMCSSPMSRGPLQTLWLLQTLVLHTMTTVVVIISQPGTTCTCLLSPNASTATFMATLLLLTPTSLTSHTYAVLRRRSPVANRRGATSLLTMSSASMSTHRTCATTMALVSRAIRRFGPPLLADYSDRSWVGQELHNDATRSQRHRSETCRWPQQDICQ